MRNAIRPVGEQIAPVTNFTPIFPSKREARLEFGCIIREFENGEIANDADVSKETVKCWKAGRAFPNGDNLLKLAQKNRVVRSWMIGKLGITEPPEFMSPQVMTVMMAALNQVAHQSGPEGDAVRAALMGMHRG